MVTLCLEVEVEKKKESDFSEVKKPSQVAEELVEEEEVDTFLL